MWNLNIPLDRARQGALGTALEHLEHVVKRIWGRYTDGNPPWSGYSNPLGTLVGATWNPNTPLNRARRVALGTTLEHLEHVVKRIRGNITWIGVEGQ